MISMYETNGVYSSKFMYIIVNDREVKHVLTSGKQLKIPHKIQISLWIFS
jgi:hypothetical protein